MLYRKTHFFMSMILTAVVLLVTGTASAQADEVAVAGGQFTVAVLDPGTSWVDEEGILHVRGLILSVLLVGSFEGLATQHLDYNLDLATGNGDLHGSAEFEGTLNGVAGVLAGHFAGDITGTIDGPLFSADSIAHGNFGGAQAHSRLTTTGILGSGVASYTGTVLFPQGQ